MYPGLKDLATICPSKEVKLLDMNGVMFMLEAVALGPVCNIAGYFEERVNPFKHEVVSCSFNYVFDSREEWRKCIFVAIGSRYVLQKTVFGQLSSKKSRTIQHLPRRVLSEKTVLDIQIQNECCSKRATKSRVVVK